MSRLLGFAVVTGVAMLSAAAYWWIPGPHHALLPRAEGLSRVAPGLWVDDPDRASEVQEVAARAEEIAAAFHGPGTRPNRVIFCTATPCAARMGLYARGLSYGTWLITLGPEGVNPTVLGHEFSHIALHRRSYLFEAVWPRFPGWFDEGLAVHVSPDPRYIRPDSLEEAEWITRARTRRHWGRMVSADNFPQAYGAAGRLVEEMATRMGPDGLRDFVDAVAAGADFHAELRRRIDWPLDP